MKLKSAGFLGVFVFHWTGPCDKSTDMNIPGCMVSYDTKSNKAQVDTLIMDVNTGKKLFRDLDDGGMLALCSCGVMHEVPREALNDGAAEWCRRQLSQIAQDTAPAK